MVFRLKVHRKLYFIAISGIGTRHHYAPEGCINGQGIFKTMILFPNHGRVVTKNQVSIVTCKVLKREKHMTDTDSINLLEILTSAIVPPTTE
ncbi:hypothetical protein AO411_2027335 [Salmonella enterica subsp. enterica serovar Sarajane]|nr:hypothetical protein AO411_2027335 [Salmonella enterica subsp. enterica serovar Sarajane]